MGSLAVGAASLDAVTVAAAAYPMLLPGVRAGVDYVVPVAQDLSANPDRRVLLLLAVRVFRRTNPETAVRITAMLSPDHPGVRWALDGADGDGLDEAMLGDLGDPGSVHEVAGLTARLT